MNWLKVAAVAIGALIAFLIVGSVVGFILHVLSYVVIAALVAGGGYVVYKIATNRPGREARDKRRRREVSAAQHDGLPANPQATRSAPPPPPPPRPAAGEDGVHPARLNAGRGH